MIRHKKLVRPQEPWHKKTIEQNIWNVRQNVSEAESEEVCEAVSQAVEEICKQKQTSEEQVSAITFLSSEVFIMYTNRLHRSELPQSVEHV